MTDSIEPSAGPDWATILAYRPDPAALRPERSVGSSDGSRGSVRQVSESERGDAGGSLAERRAALEKSLRKTASASGLTSEEQAVVSQLKARDREVRAHEQAHATVGGSYASAPTYSYEQGPDGNRYAVAGEVQIDVSPIPGDPGATVTKMEVVKAAALAPAEPSAADRQVAAYADAQRAQAMADLTALRAAERRGDVDRRI